MIEAKDLTKGEKLILKKKILGFGNIGDELKVEKVFKKAFVVFNEKTLNSLTVSTSGSVWFEKVKKEEK